MVLVAVVVATTVLGATSPPAGAAAQLEVEAGYHGNYLPGRLVPVRVRITADQLIRGVLEVRANIPGSDAVPVSMPVEVAGGTEKEYVISLPTFPVRGQVEVVAVVEGSQLRGEAVLRFSGEAELVGLLPGVTGRVPPPVTLPADMGTALFDELDDAELTTPGALDPLGTIVTGPGGLADLDDAARRNVLGWLGAGGHLVVDAAPGAASDRVAGLPDDWQPGGAERVAAGRGEVRFSAGAAAAGRWGEVVEPTPLLLPDDVVSSPVMWAAEDVATSVARDGGLRIPTMGWLAGFLVLYVLLAGPVLFLVLRLRRRSGWAWLAVPAVAGLFATGAFVVGHDARSGSEASHASIVRTGPAGTDVISFVGLVSRNGSDGRAEFPVGWSATGATSVSGLGFDSSIEVSPARVRLGTDGADGSDEGGGSTGSIGEVDLDPGGFGMVTGWGRADGVAGLTVTAEAHADGSVTGTLRNDTELTLYDPLVMVAGRPWGAAEPLAPGEEIAWDLEPGLGLPDPQAGPLEQPWSNETTMDGEMPEDSPVNYAAWGEIVGRLVDPYPSGLVVAAAWSQDWAPPVDAGGGAIDAGRTAFVAEAPVRVAAPGQLPAAAVGREFLRRVEGVDVPRLDAAREELGAQGFTMDAHTVRFRLPSSASDDLSATAPALLAKLPGSTYGVDAWDGTQWVPLPRTDWGGNPIEDDEVPGDPFTNEPSVAAIPPNVVQDGSLYLRVISVDLGGGSVSQVTVEQGG